MSDYREEAWETIYEGNRMMSSLAYDIAYRKGWYDINRSVGEAIALCHSELSEALEEVRDGGRLAEIRYEEGGKPVGFAIELADAMIRIADLVHANPEQTPERYAAELDAWWNEHKAARREAQR